TTSSSTMSLNVLDSSGSSLLTVRDDHTIGMGTLTPTAGLEIVKPNSPGLKVTAGSTSFSFGNVRAGATIALPPGTTIVRVANDGTSAANVVSFGTMAGDGELIIIINN